MNTAARTFDFHVAGRGGYFLVLRNRKKPVIYRSDLPVHAVLKILKET